MVVMKLESYLLFALLAVFVVSNVGAIVFGHPAPDRTRRAIPWLQRSTSLQLAIMAWLFWLLGARPTPLSSYSLLIAVGMSVSFAADLIMAEAARAPKLLAGGIVVFGIAHLVYLSAYWVGGLALGILNAAIVAGSIIVWLAVGLAAWQWLVYDPSMPPLLKYGSLGYTLLIAAMAATALALALVENRLWSLGVGAVLFVVSDVALGNHIFRRNDWPYVKEVVWLTYIIGQAGIVWSNLPMLRIILAG